MQGIKYEIRTSDSKVIDVTREIEKRGGVQKFYHEVMKTWLVNPTSTFRDALYKIKDGVEEKIYEANNA